MLSKKDSLEAIDSVSLNDTQQALVGWIRHCLPGCDIISTCAATVTIGMHRNRANKLVDFLKLIEKEKRMEWKLSNSTIEEVGRWHDCIYY
jgi:hypothetical protein